MELFLPRSKRDLRDLSKTLDSARFAAKLTGKTVLYGKALFTNLKRLRIATL